MIKGNIDRKIYYNIINKRYMLKIKALLSLKH